MILKQTNCNPNVERDALLSLRDRGVGGLILEPFFGENGFTNGELVRDFVRAGVPVVLVDNAPSDGEFSSITMDDYKGGWLAASHLYHRGHRDIAITYRADYWPKVRRRDGMVKALAENGISVPDEWRLCYSKPQTAPTLLKEQVRRALTDKERRPTAFCCSGDSEAVIVATVARELGLRVPEDISFIGFDNFNDAQDGLVDLASIDHPTRYIAELATNLLLHKIRYPGIVNHTTNVVQPRLIARSSVYDLRTKSRGKCGATKTDSASISR